MHDTLGPYIHVAAGGHLAVLAHTQGVEALPVVGLGVVGNDHAVSHDYARSILVAGKEPQRMAAVHDQGLLVRHGGEILHGKPVLGPVLEDGSVSAVDDELVRMLGHPLVQVVLDHGHDGGRLAGPGRILVNGPGIHLIGRPVAVHVDAAILPELCRKFRCQALMQCFREVPQRVLERQHLLLGAQDILAFGRVVNLRIVGFGFRYAVLRNAFENFLLKIP